MWGIVRYRLLLTVLGVFFSFCTLSVLAYDEGVPLLPRWMVQWYEMDAIGVFGAKVGEDSLPFTFSKNWGTGEVFAGRSERMSRDTIFYDLGGRLLLRPSP